MRGEGGGGAQWALSMALPLQLRQPLQPRRHAGFRLDETRRLTASHDDRRPHFSGARSFKSDAFTHFTPSLLVIDLPRLTCMTIGYRGGPVMIDVNRRLLNTTKTKNRTAVA